MIGNEKEYQEAVTLLKAQHDRLDVYRSRLMAAGLDDSEIKRVMDPMISFHLQLHEEVESYNRLN